MVSGDGRYFSKDAIQVNHNFLSASLVVQNRLDLCDIFLWVDVDYHQSSCGEWSEASMGRTRWIVVNTGCLSSD